jgi:COMPASS component SWD1
MLSPRKQRLFKRYTAHLGNPFTDRFAFRVPKAIQTSLVASAYFARLDSTGRYVATARSDSVAVVWDLDTMSDARLLEGHVQMITSIE